MATIINNPGATEDQASNAGLLVGIILLLVLAFALFYYGVPQARNIFSPGVSIPERIDINVNPGQ